MAALAAVAGLYFTTIMFTTPFARRLNRFLQEVEAEKAKAETKEKSVRQKKKAKGPAWLSELDSLGLVDSDIYADFVQKAVAKGDIEEARTWVSRVEAEGKMFSEADLRAYIGAALTSNDAVAAKLWLEQTLASKEIAPAQKKKIGLMAVFLIARQHGFGTVHDILEDGGEEPSEWIRNKSRWLLEILRDERRKGLDWLGERLDDALQVGVEADHSVFRYLLYEALKLPDFEYVNKWFEKAIRYGVVPETPIMNHIIGEAAKESGLTAAEAWFEAATKVGVKPNVYTYKYLIQAATQVEDAKAPEKWFKRSLEAGVAPDVVTFNTLINAAAKEGDLAAAERWFNMALSMTIRPDLVSYNMVLAAAAQAGDAPAARKWFAQLMEDGFEPDIVSYNSLMKALMKTARTGEVEELFWQMKVAEIEPDVVTIKTMRWALGRERVKELLQDAELVEWPDSHLSGAVAPVT